MHINIDGKCKTRIVNSEIFLEINCKQVTALNIVTTYQ